LPKYTCKILVQHLLHTVLYLKYFVTQLTPSLSWLVTTATHWMHPAYSLAYSTLDKELLNSTLPAYVTKLDSLWSSGSFETSIARPKLLSPCFAFLKVTSAWGVVNNLHVLHIDVIWGVGVMGGRTHVLTPQLHRFMTVFLLMCIINGIIGKGTWSLYSLYLSNMSSQHLFNV
jgi:predicted tellurium resistance membrane protein TerC